MHANNTVSVVRDMTIEDLDGVVHVQRDCFPPSLSILSALDDSVIRAYYGQFLKEAGSYAAVLEEPDSGLIIGVTCGTRKPGIKKRFLIAYWPKFLWSIVIGLVTSKQVWKSLLYRAKKQNHLSLGRYDSKLSKQGVPAPRGTEDINVCIAVHSEFRGGGNAKKLIEFYMNRIFDMGVTRIRGAILSGNVASLKFFRRQGWEVKQISDTQCSVWIDGPSIP